MEENKRVIMAGIPGVGKTTLLKKLVGSFKDRGMKVSVNSFGTVMFDVAQENGVQSRDELRKLPLSEQQRLQRTAAEKLARLGDDIVVIDTHAFISTPEGYYPGLPAHVLEIIQPTSFISVSAKPEEIYNRRMNDATRSRDVITLTRIKKDLDVQAGMISSCAVITGTPIVFISNDQGRVDEAAADIMAALGV